MLEKLVRDKRSTLICKVITYGCKKFYNIGPKSQQHLNIETNKVSFTRSIFAVIIAVFELTLATKMIVLRFNISVRFEKPWSVQKLQKCLGKSYVQMHLKADNILSCVSWTNFVGKTVWQYCTSITTAFVTLATLHQ
jgi:hypothetical protein